MKVIPVNTNPGRIGVLMSFLLAAACSGVLTGCQTTMGGQTLPSPDYLSDDVQYFPAGPEFKLTQTAENLRQHQTSNGAQPNF